MLVVFNDELETDLSLILEKLKEKFDIDNNVLIFGDFNLKYLNSLYKFNLYTNKSFPEFNISNQTLTKSDLIFSDYDFNLIYTRLLNSGLLDHTTYIKVKPLTNDTIIDTPKFIKFKDTKIPTYSFNILNTELLSQNNKEQIQKIKTDYQTIQLSSTQDYITVILKSGYKEDLPSFTDFDKRFNIGRSLTIDTLILPNSEDLILTKDLTKVSSLILPNSLVFSDLILQDLKFNLSTKSEWKETKVGELNKNLCKLFNYLICKDLNLIYVEDIKTKAVLTNLGLSKTMIKVI